MRILVDMDGVCANTIDAWLKHYNTAYFDNLISSDITTWDVHHLVKPECGLAIYKIMEREGFFYDLDPMEGVSEAFAELQARGHDLIIVTACPRNGKTSAYDKVQWLKRHIPHFDTKNFVATHRKDTVFGDLLLDDAPHNIEAFPRTTCVFNQPWNQGVVADHRVSGWSEFVSLIKNLENYEG